MNTAKTERIKKKKKKNSVKQSG
jgi:hypothetical protein